MSGLDWTVRRDFASGITVVRLHGELRQERADELTRMLHRCRLAERSLAHERRCLPDPVHILSTRSFFEERREYEHFSTHLAHNMRYFVTAGLLVCGLSGFALVGLKWNGTSAAWLALMGAKAGVWLGACGLFTYVSWVHWPWRAFASPDEFRAYRRQGIFLASGMVLLAGTGFVLGQACRLAG